MDRLECLAGRLAHDFSRFTDHHDSPEQLLSSAALVRELIVELEKSHRLPARRAQLTVLVVGPDQECRAMAGELHREGYLLLAANSTEEALALCAGYPGPIHMLLTASVHSALGTRAAMLRPGIEIVCTAADEVLAGG